MALITEAQLAAHLGVDEAELDDTQAAQVIDLASGAVVGYCGRPFEATADTEFTAYSPGRAVILPHTDVTVTEVTVAGTTADADSYRVDSSAGIVYRDSGWYGEVVVTYDHDSDTVPVPVRLATLQVAARLIENPLLLQSENFGSYGSVYGINVIGMGLITEGERQLLAPYRVPAIA